MQHHFEPSLAVKYGLVEAILLNHFEYWIELNRANEKNFYEGRYWTFNSMKALQEIFPYLSEKKIRNALKNLQEEGLLLTGNFNRSAYDRTLWYAFSDLADSILPKGQMEANERANGFTQKGEPIPNNNTYNNTDNNTNNKADCPSTISASLDDRFDRFWKLYPVKKAKQSALKAWKKINPDDTLLQTILSAVEAQKKWDSWTKENGKYIPYPATWLNQGRWEDEDATEKGPHDDGPERLITLADIPRP